MGQVSFHYKRIFGRQVAKNEELNNIFDGRDFEKSGIFQLCI